MLVKDIMSTDLVTCSVEESLQQAVKIMLQNGVGSVIVCKDETPIGIVTETDILQAGYITKRPFVEIPIRKVKSDSLITIAPGSTLRRATQMMNENNIKKLVVIEDLDPVGIITTKDITTKYHEIVAQAHSLSNPSQPRKLNPSVARFDIE